jgi:hypothetical protein
LRQLLRVHMLDLRLLLRLWWWRERWPLLLHMLLLLLLHVLLVMLLRQLLGHLLGHLLRRAILVLGLRLRLLVMRGSVLVLLLAIVCLPRGQ